MGFKKIRRVNNRRNSKSIHFFTFLSTIIGREEETLYTKEAYFVYAR